MTFSTRFISVFLGFGLLLIATQQVSAEITSPLHTGQYCTSQIQLPQDKEDLELNDVKQAVVSHLLRIGAVKHDVLVSWIGEDIIAADIIYFASYGARSKLMQAMRQLLNELISANLLALKKQHLERRSHWIILS